MMKTLPFALLFQAIIAVHSQSPCSEENRAINLEACLNDIRQKALDNAAFQFHRRPTEIQITEVPFKDRVYEQRSLVEQTFGVPSPDLSTIDRFVTMEYTSPAGSYTGCDHTVTIPNDKTFMVDPLSDTAYPSWDVREPVRHATWDFDDGDFFTLIRLDPSTSQVLHVVTNIEGNDWTGATHVFHYTAPSNPTNVVRPYPTIVYKQTSRVAPERIPTYFFNVTAFAERNGLQGPVGITWVQTLYDASSITGTEGQNCATLVADEARVTLPFLRDPESFTLSVYLRVRFTSPAFTYPCGPYTISHPATDFHLDSVAPVLDDAANYRTASTIAYHMEVSRYAPSPNDFVGRMFTLIIMNHASQFINGLIVNIRGSDVTTGTPIMPYVGPILRGEEFVNTQFFLFEQNGEMDCNLDRYIRLQPCQMPNRCFRNVDEFVMDHGMQWVGLARFSVGPSTYSRCQADPTLFIP